MGAKKRSHKTWKFTIYITGDAAKSGSAISNLKQMCDSYLGNDYAIQVIDLLEHPELARKHQILAVPTAIRTYPLPERRVIGDLSRPELVVAFLELPTQQAQTTSSHEHPVSPE
ncbi:MAG: circadian clock KaiB family protein [Dehalococcoidales bacterium]|nr:circadian clock KaiB family protein [Dehalococcoidales bacterium]